MSYIPKEYWLERGKRYREEFQYNKKFELQEKMLLDYLKNIPSFSTILEVGCGFGRITKLLLSASHDIDEYVAVDLSPHQIENAKEYTNLLRGNVDLKFIVSDIQSLQLSNQYDLVIASEVLMHILPSEIVGVIRKLVKMSNKHVVNIDWYEKQAPRKVAPHNFIHQYEKIYRNISSLANVYRIPIEKRGSWFNSVDTKQCLFHALIK